jgi:hypothetical protein
MHLMVHQILQKKKTNFILFFLGFNCSLFAYGQTGAGKSYSMIGYGVNRYKILSYCRKLSRIFS